MCAHLNISIVRRNGVFSSNEPCLMNSSRRGHLLLLATWQAEGRSYSGPPGEWHRSEVGLESKSLCPCLSVSVCCSPLPRPLLQPLLSCLSSLTVFVIPLYLCSSQPHLTFGFLTLRVSIMLNCVLLFNWFVLLFCQQLKWPLSSLSQWILAEESKFNLFICLVPVWNIIQKTVCM